MNIKILEQGQTIEQRIKKDEARNKLNNLVLQESDRPEKDKIIISEYVYIDYFDEIYFQNQLQVYNFYCFNETNFVMLWIEVKNEKLIKKYGNEIPSYFANYIKYLKDQHVNLLVNEQGYEYNALLFNLMLKNKDEPDLDDKINLFIMEN